MHFTFARRKDGCIITLRLEILEFDERSIAAELQTAVFAYAEKLARDNGLYSVELSSNMLREKAARVSMNGKACINFTINLHPSVWKNNK